MGIRRAGGAILNRPRAWQKEQEPKGVSFFLRKKSCLSLLLFSVSKCNIEKVLKNTVKTIGLPKKVWCQINFALKLGVSRFSGQDS